MLTINTAVLGLYLNVSFAQQHSFVRHRGRMDPAPAIVMVVAISSLVIFLWILSVMKKGNPQKKKKKRSKKKEPRKFTSTL